MKKIIITTFLFISMSMYGQTPETIPKDFALLVTKCQSVVVNMISGDLNTDKGDDFILKCTKGKKFLFKCDFIDSKNTVYASREMTSVLVGNDAVVKSDNDADVFIISMMTRKFYSTANINVRNGAIRGSKTCAGEFIYMDEISKDKKK